MQFRQSLGESGNSQLKSNTNKCTKERIEGKFVSKNILNLSNRVLTEYEIQVLGKGLNFVLTHEKLDHYQIKKDLERLRRDIKLRMHYKTDATPAFSENKEFKIPSNWTPLIWDAQLELYLSEIEDILLSINESNKSYPNLTKDNHEALHLLMYDDQIIIKPADEGSGSSME